MTDFRTCEWHRVKKVRYTLIKRLKVWKLTLTDIHIQGTTPIHIHTRNNIDSRMCEWLRVKIRVRYKLIKSLQVWKLTQTDIHTSTGKDLTHSD